MREQIQRTGMWQESSKKTTETNTMHNNIHSQTNTSQIYDQQMFMMFFTGQKTMGEATPDEIKKFGLADIRF